VNRHSRLVDFSHVEQASQVAAVIPGGGWRAVGRTRDPTAGPLTEQVLAWLVAAKGRATPITVDAHGHVEDAESADRLIPPGRERSSRPRTTVSVSVSFNAVHDRSDRAERQPSSTCQPPMNPGERPCTRPCSQTTQLEIALA
jgi:hypothetical protein